ncbi:secretin N-terminal domain-containing protein [Methylotenera versatilis]|uniref:Type II and III secretion system protein n=1 Tax=Methylotenera versatilis (strain 301) TaxID=666681 RepID=D7DJ68_METV0|nr:secretin N-terminal domain-containing protein [Methylotenera versatilis]ADI30103.1 type II and III secretion system protein [Methylotenera versatilis 301]
MENLAMKNTKLKRIGLYLLILQFTACQTPVPKLLPDVHVDSRLQSPTHAAQVPEKLANIAEREQKINALLADENEAWQRDDYDALTKIYEALAQYDPGNLRAIQGFTMIETAKKHDAMIAEAVNLMNKNEASDELALAKLRLVLLESPQHKKALPLYNALLAKQAETNKAKTSKKLSFNQPITMEFRDVNLKMIFESLSKTTKVNFILDKDVPSDQNATIFLKSVPFGDALDLLLETNQLEKKVLSENSVIIYLNDILHQRDYKDLSVRSFTLDYADAKQMSTILRTMLNMRNMEIDPRLNTLLIKDSPEILALAEKIIYAQDKPDPEVMLELQVMEVKRSYLQNLGVNPITGISVPVPSSGILTVKDLRVSGNSLVVNGIPGLVFDATSGDVNLLANPKIRVKNKDTARIHIGEKVPVFTANVASTGVTSQTVQYIDAGLKLEVEPTISAADDVTIKINLNVGSIGDKVVASSGASQSIAFRVGTRLATTQLRLHDGETQILAGLIDDQDRKNVSGIPGLSKIPLLGKLFSNQTDDKVKTEIVLSITPHIIRQRTPQQAHEADIWTGSEGQVGRHSPSPAFADGVAPFMVPKPPPSAAPASRDDTPKNINLALPPGFSLGGGLNADQKSAPITKPTE